jgi:hypothetical protein
MKKVEDSTPISAVDTFNEAATGAVMAVVRVRCTVDVPKSSKRVASVAYWWLEAMWDEVGV